MMEGTDMNAPPTRLDKNKRHTFYSEFPNRQRKEKKQ